MPAEVNGKTRLAGITGWPLDHTLSPAMHNAAYEAMGVNWVYVPLPVRDGNDLLGLLGCLRKLPVVGLNVTMPYKRVVMNMCDEVATAARLAGAVNTLHFSDGKIIGYNTDGRGLMESLSKEADLDPASKRALIIGTGGAAGAALVALVLGKASHITIAGRRTEVAEMMVDRVEAAKRDTELEIVHIASGLEGAVREADVIVNATPLGMKDGDEMPLDPAWLREGQVFADMVYRKGDTPAVQAARAAGATAVGGLGMLVAQGAVAIEIWNEDRQTEAPRDVMRTAAQSALAGDDPVGDV